MVTLAVGAEVHPEELVTVKLYVPGETVMVLLAPVPVIAPGFIVHVPSGSPLSTTVPVETAQVGCVTVPTTGVAGVGGCGLITISIVDNDTHPRALVTVNV